MRVCFWGAVLKSRLVNREQSELWGKFLLQSDQAFENLENKAKVVQKPTGAFRN